MFIQSRQEVCVGEVGVLRVQLQQLLLSQLQPQLQLHYIALHYTALITLHYATTTNSNKVRYIKLHYTTLQ